MQFKLKAPKFAKPYNKRQFVTKWARDSANMKYETRKPSEEFLQVIRQVRSTSVTRIHGDEDSHVSANLYLLPNQFDLDWCICV